MRQISPKWLLFAFLAHYHPRSSLTDTSEGDERMNLYEIAAIDFIPTLADIAGIEYKTVHPIDGTSLKPLLLEDDYE